MHPQSKHFPIIHAAIGIFQIYSAAADGFDLRAVKLYARLIRIQNKIVVIGFFVSCYNLYGIFFIIQAYRSFRSFNRSDNASAFQRTGKRYLVRIFKIRPDGYAVSEARNGDSHRL